MRTDDDGVPPFDFDPATPSGAVIEALNALQDAEALYRCRMRNHLGIGANDFGAFQYIARLEAVGRPVRPRDVATTLGVTSAATTIILGRLVARDYVSRHDDPSDGRGQLLHLTEAGAEKLRSAIGSSQNDLRNTLSGVTAREAVKMVGLLETVTASLERGALDVSSSR